MVISHSYVELPEGSLPIILDPKFEGQKEIREDVGTGFLVDHSKTAYYFAICYLTLHFSSVPLVILMFHWKSPSSMGHRLSDDFQHIW